MKEQMRNQLFDTVKGIAIYLVVMGHLIISAESSLKTFIEVCHMPVFFFVSGWFFSKSYERYDVRTFLKKKILSLWIPYICWSSVSFFTNGIILLIKRDAAGLLTEMTDIFLHARSVWFLIVLFITNLICLAVFRCAARFSCSPYAVGVAVWACMSVILQGGGYGEIFRIYKFSWLFPYFLLGSWCSGKRLSLVPVSKRNRALAVFLCVGAYLLILRRFCSGMAYEEFYAGFHLSLCHAGYYVIYYIGGCIGIALVFLVADIIKDRCRIMVRAGYYSMDIYVLHMFFVKVFKTFTRWFPSHVTLHENILVMVFGWGVVLFLVILAEHVLHKSALYCQSVGRRVQRPDAVRGSDSNEKNKRRYYLL